MNSSYLLIRLQFQRHYRRSTYAQSGVRVPIIGWIIVATNWFLKICCVYVTIGAQFVLVRRYCDNERRWLVVAGKVTSTCTQDRGKKLMSFIWIWWMAAYRCLSCLGKRWGFCSSCKGWTFCIIYVFVFLFGYAHFVDRLKLSASFISLLTYPSFRNSVMFFPKKSSVKFSSWMLELVDLLIIWAFPMTLPWYMLSAENISHETCLWQLSLFGESGILQ